MPKFQMVNGKTALVEGDIVSVEDTTTDEANPQVLITLANGHSLNVKGTVDAPAEVDEKPAAKK